MRTSLRIPPTTSSSKEPSRGNPRTGTIPTSRRSLRGRSLFTLYLRSKSTYANKTEKIGAYGRAKTGHIMIQLVALSVMYSTASSSMDCRKVTLLLLSLQNGRGSRTATPLHLTQLKCQHRRHQLTMDLVHREVRRRNRANQRRTRPPQPMALK